MPSKKLRRVAAFVFPAFFALVSCSRPVSSENFVLSSQAPDSVYTFSVDLYDTLRTFDLAFYSAYESADSSSVRLDVTWMNPDSVSFSETVYMPLGEPSGFECPYRTGVAPKVAGAHTLSVRVHGSPDGFRGLGLVCRINE